MEAAAPPWYSPAPRPPFPAYQSGQLFTQAPDVILEFLLLDPPLSLVDLAAQVPFRPWGMAIGLQQQYPQFVQAPGEVGWRGEVYRTATVSLGPSAPTFQPLPKCLETGRLRGHWLLKYHLHQEGPEWKHEA